MTPRPAGWTRPTTTAGSIDFRNPDSGTALRAVARLLRNTASNVIEPEVGIVQSGLCLACHDGDGANSEDAQVAGATARRPFSADSDDAADIWGALDTTNAFDYAVRGPGITPMPQRRPRNGDVVTMVPPWNQGGRHPRRDLLLRPSRDQRRPWGFLRLHGPHRSGHDGGQRSSACSATR